MKSAWVALLISTSAFATTAKDFYCKEYPASRATIYQTIVKNCGDGKVDTAQEVCATAAYCVMIDAEMEKLAQRKKKKSFNELSSAEAHEVLAELKKSTDWFMSSLTCKKKDGPGDLCPTPQECKGDFLYNARAGYLEPETLKQLDEHLQKEFKEPGTMPKFKVETQSGAEALKP